MLGYSTEEFIRPLPSRPRRALGLLIRYQLRDVQVSNTRMQVHIVRSYERRAVPDLVGDVEDDYDRRGEIHLKKGLGLSTRSHTAVVYGPRAGPKLRD